MTSRHCPTCNQRVHSVTTIGPNKHILDPCGHRAPIEIRREFMPHVLTDGSGIITDPLRPTEDQSYYLVKSSARGGSRSTCHIPTPEGAPRCNAQALNYHEKSPAVCRNMRLSVCKTCLTTNHDATIYHIAKHLDDLDQPNVLIVTTNRSRNYNTVGHLAANTLPDSLILPNSYTSQRIRLPDHKIRPKCGTGHTNTNRAWVLGDYHHLDREICKICQHGRSQNHGHQSTRLVSKLERANPEDLGLSPLREGGET